MRYGGTLRCIIFGRHSGSAGLNGVCECVFGSDVLGRSRYEIEALAQGVLS